uniref:Uncharacterized protein n=1 Tax=Oryza glaberrima TaxID=4538 RepID=I1QEJ8_ORYGL
VSGSTLLPLPLAPSLSISPSNDGESGPGMARYRVDGDGGTATTRQVDIDCIHGTTTSKRAAGKDKAAMQECHASPPPVNYFKNKADYNAAAASASAGAINYK